MGIVVALDEKQLELAKRLMSPKQLMQAMSSAVNRSTSTGRTEVAKLAKKVLNVPAEVVDEVITSFVKNNSDGTPVGLIRISQKPIPLVKFKGGKALKKGGGISVKVIKGKSPQKWRHAFEATMKPGHRGFFKRSEKGRTSGRWQRGRSGGELGQSYYSPGGVTPRGISWGLKIDEINGPSVYGVMDVPTEMARAVGIVAKKLSERFLSQFKRFKIEIPTSEAA